MKVKQRQELTSVEELVYLIHIRGFDFEEAQKMVSGNIKDAEWD